MRELSPTEVFEITQSMQVAALEAMMVTRDWQPGELIFHGGTSLHLVHGSPRYSEDLDFMVGTKVAAEEMGG